MSSLPDVLDPRDPRPEVRRALHHWLALQAASPLEPREVVELLRRTRDPARVLRALRTLPARRRRGAERSVLRIGEQVDLGASVQRLARLGCVAVPLLSRAYPPRLARLSDAAPLLLVRGDVGVLTRPSVAIVGARAATAYGRRVAHTLAGILARRGVVVVSGLARGIDAEAHRGCLEGSGVTVAVQGCGPDRVFPAAHAQLAVRIAERGALVSELPPGSPARKHHFPLRNRLISGLATCVVVVEARDRSGSLLTARHALDQGTDVLAVPGPIDAPTSVGSNRLLRDGAAPVLDVNDVLQSLGLPLVAPVQQKEPQAPFPGSPIARRILDVLADAPASLDELIRRLGRAPAEITGELVRLELEGWVTRERDGRLRLRAPAARASEPGTPGGPRGPGERGSAR